jgi:hypothetical protein
MRAFRNPVPSDNKRALGERLVQLGESVLRAALQRSKPTDTSVTAQIARAASQIDAVLETLGFNATSSTAVDGLASLYSEVERVREQINLEELRRLMSLAPSTDEAGGLLNEAVSNVEKDLQQLEKVCEESERIEALLRESARAAQRIRWRVINALLRAQHLAAHNEGRRQAPGYRPAPAERLYQPSRHDPIADHVILSLSLIYQDFTGKSAGISVTASPLPGGASIGGPFVRFCRAFLSWLESQCPDSLRERDPKLSRLFAMDQEAIRNRFRRAVPRPLRRRRSKHGQFARDGSPEITI